MVLAIIDDVASLGFVGHLELIAGFGHTLQTEDFDRRGRRGLFDRAAMIVEKRAHFAVDGADDEDVAGVQGAVLHQNGGHRAAAAIDAGFENRAAGRRAWIGAKLAQIGNEQDHLEQLIEIFLFARGDFDHDGIAAPFFRHQAAIGKLPLDAFGLGFRLIDLVDGNNDGHVRGTRVVDGFERLRHQAVIRGNDQHNEIRDLGATSAHARKGFVAGRIDEDDAATVNGNDGCADVLGYASGFAGGDFGFANGVEQAGLAVVDVTHDCNDRRPRQEIFLLLFLGDFLDDFLFEGNDSHNTAESFGQAGCRAHVQSLIDRGKNSAVEQFLQDVLGAHVQLFREVADGNAFGDGDVARRTRRLRDRLDARGPALGDAGACANRVQLAFALFESLLQRGTSASRGLAFVNWLAGLRLWRRHDGHGPRAAGSHRSLPRTRRHTAAAGPHGNRSWTSAGTHRVAAAGGSYARTR